MALPTIYIDTGGNTANSGSRNSASPLHSGSAATVSGSVVTLDGSPDLSNVAADGSDTIRITDATNTNIKIFKITAVDNALKTVTVSVAPTGVVSSTWRIGGQFLISSGNYDTDLSGAVLAGWTVQFNNSPASHSGSTFITVRASGDSTSGRVSFIGIPGGPRPILTVTTSNLVIEGATLARVTFRDLELQQGGSSSFIVNAAGSGWVFDNVWCSDSGGRAIDLDAGGSYVIDSEFSGIPEYAIDSDIGGCGVFGCYFHDSSVAGHGVTVPNSSASAMIIAYSIFDTLNVGIFVDGSAKVQIINCSIYGCSGSGILQNSTTASILIANCILMNNGDTASEYNVEAVSGANDVLVMHFNNIFYQGGAGGNLLNITANATELTTNPLFSDAPNGDFSIISASPAKGTGAPGEFPGSLSIGYPDMGAVQRQEVTPSAGAPIGISTHIHRRIQVVAT